MPSFAKTISENIHNWRLRISKAKTRGEGGAMKRGGGGEILGAHFPALGTRDRAGAANIYKYDSTRGKTKGLREWKLCLTFLFEAKSIFSPSAVHRCVRDMTGTRCRSLDAQFPWIKKHRLALVES